MKTQKLSVHHQLQLQQGTQKTVTTKRGKDSAYISIGTHSLAGRHSILAINFRNVHEDFNQPQHTTRKNGKDISRHQLIKGNKKRTRTHERQKTTSSLHNAGKELVPDVYIHFRVRVRVGSWLLYYL